MLQQVKRVKPHPDHCSSALLTRHRFGIRILQQEKLPRLETVVRPGAGHFLQNLGDRSEPLSALMSFTFLGNIGSAAVGMAPACRRILAMIRKRRCCRTWMPRASGATGKNRDAGSAAGRADRVDPRRVIYVLAAVVLVSGWLTLGAAARTRRAWQCLAPRPAADL